MHLDADINFVEQVEKMVHFLKVYYWHNGWGLWKTEKDYVWLRNFLLQVVISGYLEDINSSRSRRDEPLLPQNIVITLRRLSQKLETFGFDLNESKNALYVLKDFYDNYEQYKEMVQKTTTVAEQYASWFSRDITSVSDDIDSFLTTSYEIADDASKSRMRTCYFLIKEQLVKVRDHTKTVAWWSVYNTCYRLIWEIDKRVALLNESEDVAAMEIFMDKIKKVVNANGWTLKQTKDKLRLPNNTTAKEITWVLIWSDGRTGISQEKMALYTSLAKQATLTPQLLDRKYKNPNGSVDVLALAYVLHGMRNFIIDVKWRSPQYFEKWFLWAQAKHFPKVKVPKGTQSMQGVSNGGV